MVNTDLLVVQASGRGKVVALGAILVGLAMSAIPLGILGALICALVLLVLLCLELVRESVRLAKQVDAAEQLVAIAEASEQRAEKALAEACHELAGAAEEREMLKARLGIPVRSLEDVRLIVYQACAAAERAVVHRAASEQAHTKRPVLKLTLSADGDVDVLAAPGLESGMPVSMVRPDGIVATTAPLTDDGAGHARLTCLMGDLPAEIEEELKLYEWIAPAGYFVELPGAVDEVFDGVDSGDLERLAQQLAAAREALDLSISNRSTHG